MAKFKTGDYIQTHGETGLVIQTDINMWGEEENPPGMIIMLSDGELVAIYEDEAKNLLLYTE